MSGKNEYMCVTDEVSYYVGQHFASVSFFPQSN